MVNVEIKLPLCLLDDAWRSSLLMFCDCLILNMSCVCGVSEFPCKILWYEILLWYSQLVYDLTVLLINFFVVDNSGVDSSDCSDSFDCSDNSGCFDCFDCSDFHALVFPSVVFCYRDRNCCRCCCCRSCCCCCRGCMIVVWCCCRGCLIAVWVCGLSLDRDRGLLSLIVSVWEEVLVWV